MTDQEIAEPNEILRTLVGSTVHGLAIEGTDDRDEMGVCIPPPEYVIGLKQFEQWTWRTQPRGARSGPGDTDLVVYSLKKYVSLAAQGNPSVLIPLFAPIEAVLHTTALGEQLIDLTPAIVSRQAGYRFLGYMQSQRERMMGLGRQSRVPNRPELVEKYGFDTKYAGHVIRLGCQGVELLETGRIELPMAVRQREYCRAIRQGRVTQQAVLVEAAALERKLEQLLIGSRLSERPNYGKLNQALITMHQAHWQAKGYI